MQDRKDEVTGDKKPRRAGKAQAPEITPGVQETWRRRREDFSAGGVAYRRVPNGGIEAALIATSGGTRWQLPKGTCEAGETLEQTALREVEEEVGLQTVNEGFLKSIEYWYWDTYRREREPELVHKRVDFFLLRMVGGALSDASYEVDGVGWFTLEQAADLLTYRGEREVIRLAAEKLAQG